MKNRPLAPVEYAQEATKSVADSRWSLERRSRFAKEGQLFGGGGAPQDGVAVGVAAEAVDDGFVAQLEVQVVLYAQLRKQRYRLRMHQRGLAVHIGHVGKHALRFGQAAVLPAGHQLLRQHQRQRVLRKGARRVAVHVARELVQHDDLRQPPLSRRAPRKQLAPRRCFQRVTKPRANGFVQRGVFDEVLLGG